MPADLLPTRFKTLTWRLNKRNIVHWGKLALLFLCFYKFWRAIYSPLLTLLHFLLPHWAFYWVVFWKKRGANQKKNQGSWGFCMWGACQSVLAWYGLMEFNLYPLSGKIDCSNGLWSFSIKCLIIFMIARLILKDLICEKLRSLWL